MPTGLYICLLPTGGEAELSCMTPSAIARVRVCVCVCLADPRVTPAAAGEVFIM